MQDLNNDYINIVDNVNVSKDGDVKQFFKLVSWVAGICLFIYLIVNVSCMTIITNLTPEKQYALEQVLASGVNKTYDKYKIEKPSDVEKLREIESKILPLNKKLSSHGNFKFYIIKSEDVNAFVSADGSIYFTDKLLNEIQNEEQLCFILAHELGHYLHRDHLKMLSRGISGTVVAIGIAAATGGDESMSKVVNGSINFADIRHSQKEELLADAFANKVVKHLYNSNAEAIKFFKYIDKSDNEANALYFFSTHPSPKDRIKALEKDN